MILRIHAYYVLLNDFKLYKAKTLNRVNVYILLQ